MTTDSLPLRHSSYELEKIFNHCFSQSENTVLIGGGDEPVYKPAQQSGERHRIIYTKDYFASALHEIAHWCVAGPKRRLLEDFGYWYNADGRSQEQQVLFELVEVKPQALEWIFSNACAFRFRVSADNLRQGLGASDTFKRAIVEQAGLYIDGGIPKRARQFAEALAEHFGSGFNVKGVYAVDALD